MLRINAKTRELFVYDEIGPAWAGMVGAVDFVDALGELGSGDVNIRLNSPGGTADEAFAAVEILKRHDGQVNVTVDSVAASAATFFLNKQFSVTAAPTARMMIHNASTITWGTAKDHAKTIEILGTYDASIIQAYSRINKTADELTAMLEAETWLTAKEALAIGLIDSITEDAADVPAAKIREGRYLKTPKDLIDQPIKIMTPNRIAASLKLRQIAAKLRTK